MADVEARRANQKRRTRKDLLQAASRLIRQGKRPSLEEIAEAALVSRATAYRYFPSLEALLAEAAVDVASPTPDELFAGEASGDPVVRVQRVGDVLHDLTWANETSLRMMLALSMQRQAGGGGDADLPARQNRRSPLIEAALEPARQAFTPEALDTLAKALAVVIGTEAMVVNKDVLQIDSDEARRVLRWAIRALVEAARTPG
jgi:AcrR family transcriptional regulator